MQKTIPLLINQHMLNELVEEARNVPRKRKHRNFHAADNAPCHRLIIAIEPGSYIPPHCHATSSKDETITIMQGRIGMVFFDTAGKVSNTTILQAGGDVLGVTIPHGMMHSLVSLQSGSVFFEAKAGPYLPPTEAERASWAPLENTADAPAYLAQLEALFSR